MYSFYKINTTHKQTQCQIETWTISQKITFENIKLQEYFPE